MERLEPDKVLHIGYGRVHVEVRGIVSPSTLPIALMLEKDVPIIPMKMGNYASPDLYRELLREV